MPEVILSPGRGDSLHALREQKLVLHAQGLGNQPAFFGVLGALDRFLNRGQSLRDLVGPA